MSRRRSADEEQGGTIGDAQANATIYLGENKFEDVGPSQLEFQGVPQLPRRSPGDNPISLPQVGIPQTKIGEEHVFWAQYLKAADVYDTELVKTLCGDLDTLLIFAGLFSAISTAFIIESYQDLKPDPAESGGTNALLRLIALSVNTTATATGNLADPPFTAPHTAVVANALFFTSLSCSLFSAFGAVLAKQWLSEYERTERHRTPEERARRRHAKYLAMERYHCELVVQGLGSVLQLSLFIFLVALTYWLWHIHLKVAYVALAGAATTFTFYAFTTLLSIIDHVSPFSTRLSAAIRRIWPSPPVSTYPKLKDCGMWLSGYATTFEGITAVYRVFLHLLDSPDNEPSLDTGEVSRVLMGLVLSTNVISLGVTNGTLLTTLNILLDAKDIWKRVEEKMACTVALQLHQILPKAMKDAYLTDKILMVLADFYSASPSTWYSASAHNFRTLLLDAIGNPTMGTGGQRSALSLLWKYYLNSERNGQATSSSSWQWTVAHALVASASGPGEQMDEDDNRLDFRVQWATRLRFIPSWANDVAWEECFGTEPFSTYIHKSAERPRFHAILAESILSTRNLLPLGLSTKNLLPTIKVLREERGVWRKVSRRSAYEAASQLHQVLEQSRKDVGLCEKIVLTLEEFVVSVQLRVDETSLPPSRELLLELMQAESISTDGKRAILSLLWAYHLNKISSQHVYEIATSTTAEASWAQQVARALAITADEADEDTTRFIFRLTWAQALSPAGVEDYPLNALWGETFGSSMFQEYVGHATIPASPGVAARWSPWTTSSALAWNLWNKSDGCRCGVRTEEAGRISSCLGVALLSYGALEAAMKEEVHAQWSGSNTSSSWVTLHWWNHLRLSTHLSSKEKVTRLVTRPYLRVIIELIQVKLRNGTRHASRMQAMDDLRWITGAVEGYIDDIEGLDLEPAPVPSKQALSESVPDQRTGSQQTYAHARFDTLQPALSNSEGDEVWGDIDAGSTAQQADSVRLLQASGHFLGQDPADVYQPLYEAFKRAIQVYTGSG